MKPTANALSRPYDEQAQKFLENTSTEFKIKLLGSMPYFEDDKENRDVYQVTLTRNGKSYSFRFGQSLMFSREYVEKSAQERENRGEPFFSILKYKRNALKVPSAYSVLAAITKNDPDTFENFCHEFGYDTDSRKAMELYIRVQNEWKAIDNMFGDVMDTLQEIQ